MLAVTGYGSRIVDELRKLLPADEQTLRIDDLADWSPDRYLLCAGILRPLKLHEQTVAQITESMLVNLIRPMQLCDLILERNDKARICVIGSESGFSWSFDGTYAAAKAALHRYVETKKLKPDQQLVCVAPSIIEDCAMTLRREDKENLERRRKAHPKQRFLKAVEIAKLIHFLLYVDQGYISNTVIRVNGGGN
jgi:NAD(P)-dependent dehydrogenase (short-subunit alcohol dehydrogenase family)